MQATEEYIHVLTSALSVQTGVKIQAGKTWQANVKDKVLIYPKDSLRLLPFYAVRGLLLHELSHILYSTPSEKPTDAIKEYGEKVVFNAFDAFEDERCEDLMTLKFGEFSQRALADMNYYGIARNIDKCHGDFTQYKKWEQYMMICHFYNLTKTNRELIELVGYDCSYLTDDPTEFNIMTCYWVNPEVRKHFKKTQQQVNDIWALALNAKTSKDLLDIVVQKYLPLVKPLMDKQDKQEQQQKQQGGSKSAQSGQQGQPPPSGGQPSQQDKQDQPQPSPASISEQLKSDVNAEVILGKNKVSGKGTKAGNFLDQQERRHQRLSEAETAALMRPYINTLATRLRYILQEKAATRFRGLYKQGKLLGKNAYRVLLPNEERIFSQKSTPDAPKHAVYMALDKSGSMDGDRETFAFIGAVVLKHVSKALGFPVKLYEFDRSCYSLDNLDFYHESGGGTADEAAFEHIYKDASPSDDNLVFLVTDGDTHEGNRWQFIHKLEREKNAQVFGIGIGNGISYETVKRNYPHALRVAEPKELPAALINLMRSIIHR